MEFTHITDIPKRHGGRVADSEYVRVLVWGDLFLMLSTPTYKTERLS